MDKSDKNKVKALKKARHLISNLDEDYICFALDTVAGKNPALAQAIIDLKCYINYQLSPTDTLLGWQHNNDVDFIVFRNIRADRADRIAWIDWMINELETPPTLLV